MKKIDVFVVGVEGSDKFGVSFWSWYPLKENADKVYNEMLNNPKLVGKGIIYRGTVNVEYSDSNEYITIQVEDYLEEHNWENSFI